MLKTIIVDDEKPARDELIYLLQKIGEIEIVGEADNGEDAVELVLKERPDVVFLDIEMSHMDGLTVAKEILQVYSPQIVFATAYDHYAVKAFELHAVDYVLKPFSEERLRDTMERIKKLKKSPGEDFNKLLDLLDEQKNTKINRIAVNHNGKMILLHPEDIIFIETQGRNCIIHSIKGDFTNSGFLGELEEKLKGYAFFRIHRSYIINLEKIKEVIPWFQNTYQVVMEGYDEQPIPVSRTNIKKFKEILNI